MKDLLTLTESSSYEELYNKIKAHNPYEKSNNKYVDMLALRVHSPIGSSVDKARIRGSMDMEQIAQNSISVDTENKLALTFLNAGLQIQSVKFIDPESSAKDILKTMLEDKDWAGVVMSSPVQNLSDEALLTISQVAKSIEDFDRKCFDVIAVGNNGCVSLASENYMAGIESSKDIFSHLKPFIAYKSELKEYYYQPKKPTIEDTKGFHEYMDYHVQKEIVGLNYANDREQINRLLAVKLNPHYKEYSLLLTLDKQGDVTALHTAAEGTVDKATIYPSKMLELMQSNPDNQYCVLAHNHPSGNADASKADLTFTEDVTRALSMLDYTVLEHTIVARDSGFFHISYYDEQLDTNLSEFDEKFLEKEPEMTM